ncbi:uncharacterized protein LOC125242322 [Leguminivora glycinivorella]|uniref:uncharacterized protein LOC125242322 n=1 Tax=Leguminivora glycinivorella TaxID=1035111 RepID=UPI00200FAE8C|nr:uncharacterized protein LOC125242322 [Leguminivora glycinivorella]
MGLPRLEKCCCFFDLQTGNIILGCLNAFLSFCLFVAMIVAAVELGTMERDTATEMGLFMNEEAIELDAKLSGLYAVAVILVFMFLAKLLFDVFFVIGVIMERKGIIKAYYIMWTAFMILSTFTFFLNWKYWGVKMVLTEVIFLGINIYSVLVCHSFYVQLNMREEV